VCESEESVCGCVSVWCGLFVSSNHLIFLEAKDKMFRGLVASSRRIARVGVPSRSFADATAAAPSGSNLVINFNTPHATVLPNKQVKFVILPGENGEYGVTAGHGNLISQLKPGVVAVHHVSVSVGLHPMPVCVLGMCCVCVDSLRDWILLLLVLVWGI
jgi:hypothetical protein